MKKLDGRKLSTERQQQIRYTAIDLCNSGQTQSETANILRINSSSVSKWWKKYKEHGIKGLVIKKRGIKPCTRAKLSPEQILTLKNTLIEYTPDQLDLNFSLWTRQAIKNLIIKYWKINICLTTVGRYMKKLGFTPQKPIKRAYEQDPKAVDKWLNKTYPQIVKKALKNNGEIHWLDETGINTYSNYLKSYAPKGKTPLIKMKAKRMSLNIISSISKLGKMRFMTYTDNLNTDILIKFIKRLCKNNNKKLFIILDNLAVHRSKKFMKCIASNKAEVFYLPPYSPELNPDERLNRDLKTHFHNGLSVKNAKELKNKILSFLIKVQKSTSRISNYFNSDYVRYAA